jgi:hypothetical protein
MSHEPRFPLYIVSKGRWESRLTHRALVGMGVPHYIVVEESERAAYAAACHPLATILTLDPRYKADYDCFDEFGLTKSTGPGPARNFAWEHALALEFPWHWVMDDNIDGFFRLNYNLKTPAATGAIFRAMEDFALRYSNVAMAGPNYFMFASRKTRMPAFVLNTRIYSCNLIRNDVPFRWRGRYNEDTDLSLRILKAGWVTVQFNAFLQYKLPTQQIAGGNTDEFYASEGTRPKSEMLAKMHPDVAIVTERFGRVHHFVDYGPFKRTLLKLAPGASIPTGTNDYGMVLEQRVDDRWVRIERPKPEKRKPRYAEGVAR